MTKKLIKRKAAAKINLFLEILGKREDGYNEIQTIFSLIDVYDHLNFILTKNNTVKILTDTDSLQQADNLIYKVAIFIKNKYNVKSGVIVELKKNIPLAAGLGGGSSNAASTIIALDLLWELHLSEDEKHEIAAHWGSDINFFLNGPTAFGEGRGEKITSLSYIPIEHILLVNPGIEIASSEAYQLVQHGYTPNSVQELLTHKRAGLCFNRLEEGIRKKYRVIDEIIQHLENNGANKAILSGSGATVIGFCPNHETAKCLNQYYSEKGYWNTITKTKGEPNEHYRC